MTNVQRVRVGRFVWERLLLMSDLPESDRFRLLALGVFMDSEGGRARPGNAGLALFGPHEETWKKLLRRTVSAGWLDLVERGGARRGPGGTTITRASVYAAAVPQAVWDRRADVLGRAPFRRQDVEGSALVALNEAPPASFIEDAPLKEAPKDFLQAVPQVGSEPMKEAPADFLQEALEGTAQPLKEAQNSFEGSPQGLPHHAVPTSRSNNTRTATTSAPVAPRKRAAAKKATEPKPNKHQVADDLTAAFWKHHGKGRAQPFVAVRQIVRTAIGNGVDRDDLAFALNDIAGDGSIAGWKLDKALAAVRKRRGSGQFAQILQHDQANNGRQGEI